MQTLYSLRRSRLRVLIASASAVLCAGIAVALSRRTDMELVGEAQSAQQTIDFFCELQPDVLVTDLNFADIRGKSLVAQVRQMAPKAKIVVCSLQVGGAAVKAVMQAGAQGYVSWKAT